MANRPGWYPPSQVCYPPELPAYLKNVYDLTPIVGAPCDDEVIKIHSAIHAANRVSVVPGMTDPDLLMKLADHLFSVQMARYRSKYSLITFPSDAIYHPPALPAHVSVALGPVIGAPSDEEIVKVQGALREYQHFSGVASMFDSRVNMELSQHLFDIQMARYMRVAGEGPPSLAPETIARPESIRSVDQAPNPADEETMVTNNAGTGASSQRLQPGPVAGMHEIMEHSNQLAERFNQLLEQSNKLMQQYTQPPGQPNSWTLAEHFSQVLERLTQLVERSHQPTDQSQQLAERFNRLLDRFNQLAEQSNQAAQRANELAKRSNQIAERANELTEQAREPVETLGVVLTNINKVLVGIQHAIVRNHKGNKPNAVDCLVNETGRTPGLSGPPRSSFRYYAEDYNKLSNRVPVVIDGSPQDVFLPDSLLGPCLYFYGIHQGICQDDAERLLKKGMKGKARARLGNYFSSCLG